MPTITVKNIPEDLYARLKAYAAANRRSVNSQVIVCIERMPRVRPRVRGPGHGGRGDTGRVPRGRFVAGGVLRITEGMRTLRPLKEGNPTHIDTLTYCLPNPALKL